MKFILYCVLYAVLVNGLMACMVFAGDSSVSRISEKYHDGCYYIITDRGGITPKVNQPASCESE